MAEPSAFRGVIELLDKIGVYDIILPFILVFTIIFAVLEKTKVLGTEEVGGRTLTKKNLNSMVAFVVAFLVIASIQLVGIINEVMANVVLLVLLSVCFLMLVGTFYGSEEFKLKADSKWMTFFMILMFIGIVAIFLNALDWLQYLLVPFIYFNEDFGAGIIFLAIIIGFVVFVTKTPKTGGDKK